MINHASLLLDGHPGVTRSSDRCFPKPRQLLLNTRSEQLDAVVDRAFGASRKLSNERQRLELLFSSYKELSEQ